jgi:hypothetical protein
MGVLLDSMYHCAYKQNPSWQMHLLTGHVANLKQPTALALPGQKVRVDLATLLNVVCWLFKGYKGGYDSPARWHDVLEQACLVCGLYGSR